MAPGSEVTPRHVTGSDPPLAGVRGRAGPHHSGPRGSPGGGAADSTHRMWSRAAWRPGAALGWWPRVGGRARPPSSARSLCRPPQARASPPQPQRAAGAGLSGCGSQTPPVWCAALLSPLPASAVFSTVLCPPLCGPEPRPGGPRDRPFRCLQPCFTPLPPSPNGIQSPLSSVVSLLCT